MQHKSFHLKATALFLAVSFLSMDLAFAAPVSQPAPSFVSSTGIESLVFNPSNIQIPFKHATLQETHAGTNGKLIVHIQDAHVNLSGQKSLAGILDAMMTTYDISTVLMEGGDRDVTLDSLKSLTDKDTWKIVAGKLLYKGIINGAEYLNLTGDHALKLEGIEHADLYDQNLRAYAKLVDNREKILNWIRTAQINLDRVKNQVYPKTLLDYEQKKKSSSGDWSVNMNELFHLTDAVNPGLYSQFPEVQKLKVLKQTEASLDFASANQEQSHLLDRLSKTKHKETVESFIEASKQIGHSQVSQLNLLNSILDLVKQEGLSEANYPALSAYHAYLQAFDRLEMEALLIETEVLEDSIYKEVLPNDETKKIRILDKYLALVKKAYSIQMTAREFATLMVNEPDFDSQSWVNYLDKVMEQLGLADRTLDYKPYLNEANADLKAFYSWVNKRDEAFVENTDRILTEKNQTSAFLVTGGYHTENLTRLLREEGYSYIVLTPQVTQETDQTQYEAILLESIQNENLEKSSSDKQDSRLDTLIPAAFLETISTHPQGARMSGFVEAAGSYLGETDILKTLQGIPMLGARVAQAENPAAMSKITLMTRINYAVGVMVYWATAPWFGNEEVLKVRQELIEKLALTKASFALSEEVSAETISNLRNELLQLRIKYYDQYFDHVYLEFVDDPSLEMMEQMAFKSMRSALSDMVQAELRLARLLASSSSIRPTSSEKRSIALYQDLAPYGVLLGARAAEVRGGRLSTIWPAKIFKNYGNYTRFASFSSDGTKAMTVEGNMAIVWDVNAPGDEAFVILGGHHRGPLSAASFSPDGTRILTASLDGTVILWDATNQFKPLAISPDYRGPISSASFSPDGTKFLTVSWNGSTQIWNTATGKSIGTLKDRREIIFASFSPDSTKVLTVLLEGAGDNTVKILDITTGKLIATLRDRREISSASFSPDGTKVLTVSFEGMESSAKIWDIATHKLIVTLKGHDDVISSASFSPDGTQVLTASWDGTAKIWDSITGKSVTTLRPADQQDRINFASFSPDGTKILTASEDGTTIFWDAATFTKLTNLVDDTSHLLSASFSPKGDQLLAISSHGNASIWDLPAGSRLSTGTGLTARVQYAVLSTRYLVSHVFYGPDIDLPVFRKEAVQRSGRTRESFASTEEISSEMIKSLRDDLMQKRVKYLGSYLRDTSKRDETTWMSARAHREEMVAAELKLVLATSGRVRLTSGEKKLRSVYQELAPSRPSYSATYGARVSTSKKDEARVSQKQGTRLSVSVQAVQWARLFGLDSNLWNVPDEIKAQVEVLPTTQPTQIQPDEQELQTVMRMLFPERGAAPVQIIVPGKVMPDNASAEVVKAMQIFVQSQAKVGNYLVFPDDDNAPNVGILSDNMLTAYITPDTVNAAWLERFVPEGSTALASEQADGLFSPIAVMLVAAIKRAEAKGDLRLLREQLDFVFIQAIGVVPSAGELVQLSAVGPETVATLQKFAVKMTKLSEFVTAARMAALAVGTSA